jgi:hypothetical protein
MRMRQREVTSHTSGPRHRIMRSEYAQEGLSAGPIATPGTLWRPSYTDQQILLFYGLACG